MRAIKNTTFVLALCVALLYCGVCLGAEPKKKKIVPQPLPLLPAVQQWVATLDDQPTAPGAMDDQRVYVPLAPARVVALSRETGDKVWVREDVESRWPPVVIGDTLYLVSVNTIVALDSLTGKDKWSAPFEHELSAPLIAFHAPAPGKVEGPAASGGDGLLAIADKGVLLSLSKDDGRVLWMRDLGVASRFAPATDGTRALVALDDSRAVAVRLSDGRVEWEQKLDGMLNQPAVAHDRFFVGTNTNMLYALDDDSGRIAWKWKAGGDVIGTTGDVKSGAYYASLDNVLRAVNRGNGNQRWIKEIPARPLLPPQTYGYGDGKFWEEVVVLTGATSEIDAFAAKTGKAVGTYQPPSDLEGPPLIDSDLKPYRVAMVVITRDGRAIGLIPSAMQLPEPLVAPLLTEIPGRKLERERITPPPTR